MPYTSYSEREREMMRRARPAHRLVKHGLIEGWKALELITAPRQELEQHATRLGIDIARWDGEAE